MNEKKRKKLRKAPLHKSAFLTRKGPRPGTTWVATWEDDNEPFTVGEVVSDEVRYTDGAYDSLDDFLKNAAEGIYVLVGFHYTCI